MNSPDELRSGILEIPAKGAAMLRDPVRHFRVHSADPVVPTELIERFSLKPGLLLSGRVVGTQSPSLTEIVEIEGQGVDTALRPGRRFEDLTAVDPTRLIRLETESEPLTMRVIDLITPVGRGQRGLIVAPPRTGKTILLQQIAAAVARNHPEMRVIVLLVDERPEEVTEMRRTVAGQVLASSSDNPSDEHIRLAELTIQRAQRLAESGADVLLLIDSLTRLARAYNRHSDHGRTMSGGVDIKALDRPKRLFGTARAFEEGGSLTILATCLIETGSRMDEVIFQEFKGTGNLEIVLDRRLADRRVYPAIDLFLSGTRKEERLLPAETLKRVTMVRRTLAGMKPVEAMETLVKHVGRFPSNSAFLDHVGKALTKP